MSASGRSSRSATRDREALRGGGAAGGQDENHRSSHFVIAWPALSRAAPGRGYARKPHGLPRARSRTTRSHDARPRTRLSTAHRLAPGSQASGRFDHGTTVDASRRSLRPRSHCRPIGETTRTWRTASPLARPRRVRSVPRGIVWRRPQSAGVAGRTAPPASIPRPG
jgi:hypothetical protein